MQPAQFLPQLVAVARRRNVYRALCHEPAARVPTAPVTQTATTIRAVCATATRATTPPAASIIAAANCGGAMARIASYVGSTVWLWMSAQVPNTADITAAHTHSVPAINMCQQYESASEFALPSLPVGYPESVWSPTQCDRVGTRFGSGDSPGTNDSRLGVCGLAWLHSKARAPA